MMRGRPLPADSPRGEKATLGPVALPFGVLHLSGPRAPDFPIPYARHSKTLGEHLRKERLLRGPRQRVVAEQFGVTDMTVGNRELGKEQPTIPRA